jgi:flagellar FliJ protein
MKKFHFPLRPVGVLRSHRELRAREVFAAAVHEYVRTEERLANIRTRLADFEEMLFAGRSVSFVAADAASLFKAYRMECQAAMEAEHVVIEAREVMHKRRSEYIEANRQLKVVERLEERARLRHRAEATRADQKELDEFAGYRASRRIFLT